MDVGMNCIISDEWLPPGLPTGIFDVNGKELKTRSKVSLRGCTSRFAYVGKSLGDEFVLYFGSKDGSTSWDLTQEVATSKHLVLCEDWEFYPVIEDSLVYEGKSYSSNRTDELSVGQVIYRRMVRFDVHKQFSEFNTKVLFDEQGDAILIKQSKESGRKRYFKVHQKGELFIYQRIKAIQQISPGGN